jgi:hypothetical protein
MYRALFAGAVLAVALIASPASAQVGATGLVAALPGEINFAGATTRDGGRTSDVEVVLAPAQDVRFRTDGISVAFWSPDRRLVVTRVSATGTGEYTLDAGATKRSLVRFVVPTGYDWHVLSGSLQWEYQPLHPIAVATAQPLEVVRTTPLETPVPIATVQMRPRPKTVSHEGVIASRCQAGSGEGAGLTRSERFDLAMCLVSGGHEAQALHALRPLAHELGPRYNGGIDRATFVQTWLEIAQLDEKRGKLSDADHAATIASANAGGSGLENQATSAHRHYAALAQAARATPAPIVHRTPYVDPVAGAIERVTRGSSSPRSPPSSVSAGAMEEFSSDTAAQRHCPRDTVVWLNTNSGIYHYAGMRWYGNTNYGAYVCEREAVAAGNRATENGQ